MSIKNRVSVLLSDIKPLDWFVSLFLCGLTVVGILFPWDDIENSKDWWFFWCYIVLVFASFNIGQILKEKKSPAGWALLIGNGLLVLSLLGLLTLYFLEKHHDYIPIARESLKQSFIPLLALVFVGRTWQFWFNKLSKKP